MFKNLRIGLLLLLAARLSLVVGSDAGIGWDFKQLHRTGSRVWRGQASELYMVEAKEMKRFELLIGEGNAEPTGKDGRAVGSGQGTEAMVPSGRLGHIGAPLAALFFATVGGLPPRQALFAFKAQCALFFCVALLVLFRRFKGSACQEIRHDLVLPTFLALCLLFEPFWFVFSTGGQATALSFLLLAGFHHFYTEKQFLGAAAIFSLCILIKPFFLLSLVIFAMAGDWRFLKSITLTLALWGALSLAIFGPALHWEWIDVLRVSAGSIAEPWWNNSSVLALFYIGWAKVQSGSLGPAGEIYGAVVWFMTCFKAGILLLFGYLVRALGKQNFDSLNRRHHVIALSLLFPLMFSSIVWPHYLSFLFIPLLFLLFSARQIGRFPQLLVWSIAISTLAVHSRFLQKAILALLNETPWLQVLAAGLFGSTTLLLTLSFLAIYGKGMIELKLLDEGEPSH